VKIINTMLLSGIGGKKGTSQERGEESSMGEEKNRKKKIGNRKNKQILGRSSSTKEETPPGRGRVVRQRKG